MLIHGSRLTIKAKVPPVDFFFARSLESTASCFEIELIMCREGETCAQHRCEEHFHFQSLSMCHVRQLWVNNLRQNHRRESESSARANTNCVKITFCHMFRGWTYTILRASRFLLTLFARKQANYAIYYAYICMLSFAVSHTWLVERMLQHCSTGDFKSHSARSLDWNRKNNRETRIFLRNPNCPCCSRKHEN